MSPEAVVAVLGALTALVAAVTALLIQVSLLRRDVNGRVSEMMTLAGVAQHKKGELEGRDFMTRYYLDRAVGPEVSPPPPDAT